MNERNRAEKGSVIFQDNTAVKWWNPNRNPFFMPLHR